MEVINYPYLTGRYEGTYKMLDYELRSRGIITDEQAKVIKEFLEARVAEIQNDPYAKQKL